MGHTPAASVRQSVLDAMSKIGPNEFKGNTLFVNEVTQFLGAEHNFDTQKEILVWFFDLFRQGLICWGDRAGNPTLDGFFRTDRGKKAAENLSRDPANPEGYMQYLTQQAALDEVTGDYVREALNTYNQNCYKATAVMIGAAAENMLLDLRDTLLAAMMAKGKAPPKKLNAWQAKTVLEATIGELRQVLQDGIKADPKYEAAWRRLLEEMDAYLLTFAHYLRCCRNDAGHPASLEPVTAERAHGSLLMFPDVVRLVTQLKNWIQKHYNTIP